VRRAGCWAEGAAGAQILLGVQVKLGHLDWVTCPCEAICDGSHHGPEHREDPLPSSAPALLKLWIQAKPNKASRLGQGRPLPHDEREGKEERKWHLGGEDVGWEILGVMPAAAEPPLSRPLPRAPRPPQPTQAFEVSCAGRAGSRAGPLLLP